MRRRGPVRALRGLAAGLLTTFLALLFHVLGGGDVPSPLAMAVSAAAVSWAAILISRTRPSLPLLILAVAAGQLILHTAFAMTTGSAELLAGGSGHHGGFTVAAAHAGGTMWLAHVTAGLFTVAAIREGERVLRGLVAVGRSAARSFVRILPALIARRAPARRTVVIGSVPRRRLPRIASGIGSVVVRRGPPALAV